MPRTPRKMLDVQKDLDLWESQLDKHLGHCATCDDGGEKYCREGTEISVMVTRLLMEKMRLQLGSGPGVRFDAGAGAPPADAEREQEKHS